MIASAFTGEVEIDGINYFIRTTTNYAEVRSKNPRYSGDVVIPATIEYEGVTCNVVAIGSGAFEYCTNLTSITIPNSVTSIGGSAFYYCTSLTSVNISDIAAWCNISFNDNPLNYAHHLYLNGVEVIDLVIPNSVTSIGQRAFSGCSSLTSVTIPNSVTSIGDSAFRGCTSLTSVTIGNSVTSIGSGAFENCTSLTSVTIPNSVTSIGSQTFSGCTSLTSITIPNSVTSIGIQTFYGCTNLTSITIPNSVTSIGYQTFYGCTSLTSVTIGNSVTSIGQSAFTGCTSLTSITIPNSLTSISDYAFSGCTSLTSVTIGSGIQNIGQRAFANCPDLTHVYCHAINVPNTRSDAFQGSYPQYATLHVPDESIGNYRNSYTWNEFGTIVGLSGGGGGGGSTEKCAKPTISYQSGKLVFNCATSGATCQYSITDTDITSGSGNQVQLTVTYNVSVYATKAGMENSDVATATLCWIDKEPTINTNISNAVEFSATPILIQSEGGQLTIQGADDGTPISVFTTAGMQAGSTISRAGLATLSTNLQPGSIAIIKIGNRSVKVVMK